VNDTNYLCRGYRVAVANTAGEAKTDMKATAVPYRRRICLITGILTRGGAALGAGGRMADGQEGVA